MRRLRRSYQRNARQEAKRRKKFKQRAPLETQMKHSLMGRRKKSLTGRAIAAGTAAAITLGAGVCLTKALAHTPDIHELPVSQDADADLLADAEELALGYCPFNPDQNRNEIPDGVDLAKRCFPDINDLPWQNEADPEETYKWWAPQYGLHTCDICGATMAMGLGGVVNPRLGLDVRFPFLMTLHYMEHGSFSYEAHYGSEPVQGRVDVSALVQAIELTLPFDPNAHQMPVPEDADADLLSNKEEFAIGYRVFNPDQNRNETLDGVELAKRCTEVINLLARNGLPGANGIYRICHEVDGVEQCDVCGQWIHMGGCIIINPKLGLQYPDPCDPLEPMFLPDLALHYMEHGSFDCYGDIHQGRVDLQRLMRVLELRFPYEPNEHQLPADGNDLDGDFLTDAEELATGYNLYNPDQDQDLTPDGIELAKQCVVPIDELPVHDPYSGGPPPDETYKISFFQRGLEQCDICGTMRNMGYWLVVNPRLELSIEVPDIVCHYMSHGSFSYAGDVHGKGRIDVPLLVKILEMPRRCGDLGTVYLPGDLNEDCKVDFTDFAELADKWLESTDPNQDGDTER